MEGLIALVTVLLGLVVILSVVLFGTNHDKRLLRKRISDMEIDQRFDSDARAAYERFAELDRRLDAIEDRCRRVNPLKD